MKLYQARGIVLHLCNQHGRQFEETHKGNKKEVEKELKIWKLSTMIFGLIQILNL